MRPWSYRLMVIGGALAWLLLGLHLPTVHEVADHGWAPPASVLAMIVVLAIAAAAAMWALLRLAPRGGAGGVRDE